MILLPKNSTPFWREFYPSKPLYPSLGNDIKVDVAVVGAGITGLSTAYFLKKSGLTVAVLDKKTVGEGTTGRTTGKVTSQHNLVYSDLVKRLGKDKARIYGEANEAALAKINDIIANEKIDCDWQREDNYVYTLDPRKIDTFKQEAHIASTFGLPASYTTDTPLPFKVAGAVKFTQQAKFNSLKYVLGLARAVDGDGSYVFEKSTVIGIKDGQTCRIKTSKGTVTAKQIVVASSVPTFPLVARAGYGILEYPSESYIVAGKLNKNTGGMYISPDKGYYSILPITTGGTQMLLIGGESHFWGLRGDTEARFQRLADFAEKHFGITAIDYRWSDRDYLAYDGIPLVGKLYPWSKNIYVGTAFKKWGLTNGTVAGMILDDAISGRSNPWASTFNSNRLGPVKALPRIITKNVF